MNLVQKDPGYKALRMYVKAECSLPAKLFFLEVYTLSLPRPPSRDQKSPNVTVISEHANQSSGSMFL